MQNLVSRFGRNSTIWHNLATRTIFFPNARNSMNCSGLNCQTIPKTYVKIYSSSLGIFLRQNSRAFTQSRVLKSSETAAAAFPTTNGFLKWYLEMVRKHPVLTKSVTAASILTVADTTSQVIAFAASDGVDALGKLEFDIQRTLRMTAYGFFLSGPTLHLWFNFMSRILPKTDIASTVKKMVLGQTLYGPVITVVFFSVNALLQVFYGMV